MSVYRIENNNSWMGKQKWGTLDESRLKVIDSQVKMFRGFGGDYPTYKTIFNNKISHHINFNIPRKSFRYYLNFFKGEISRYSLRWKIDVFFKIICISIIRKYYLKLFQRKYLNNIVLYK